MKNSYQPFTFILRAVGALLLFAISGCNQLTPKDTDGNRPEDIVRRFIEFARAKNYNGTATCWRDGDIKNIEANRRVSFVLFCQSFECDTYQIEADGVDKGFYWVRFVGVKAGKKRAELFFLADPSNEKDGRWRLMEDRWIPDSAR